MFKWSNSFHQWSQWWELWLLLKTCHHKLSAHCIPCIYLCLRFSSGYKGWVCFDADTQRLYCTQHAVFDETWITTAWVVFRLCMISCRQADEMDQNLSKAAFAAWFLVSVLAWIIQWLAWPNWTRKKITQHLLRRVRRKHTTQHTYTIWDLILNK